MAEEKKDSFTFSDKIKSSKPAVNPFAKRGSKVGSNGKPKKTLFERTRRDAPFFIAAILALLLLPFLYRYSGTVHEEGVVTPIYGDSVFEPERFGFSPSVEDPSGQIVQLTGRDPLSLIKGWGTPEEEKTSDRDGLYEEPYSPAPQRRDVEDSYRQTAPAATRAAFKRASTPIKEIGHASMNLRGGGGIGSHFGGASLKRAASKDSSGGPKKGVKPVSLQPLRAAGNPSRSYYGQGGAAQARASRNAMGKADAVRAISDAVFTPVESRRIGGLGDGVFAAGGGAGKWDRNMNFKGITPWWWDMMKQQEMEKWKWKYFLWRKPLADAIGTIIGEAAKTIGLMLGNWMLCFTGDSKGDMGSFGATLGSAGNPAQCKIGSKWYSYDEFCYGKDGNAPLGAGTMICSSQDIKNYQNWCNDKNGAAKNSGLDVTPGEWKDEKKAEPPMNYVQRVRHCWNESSTPGWKDKGTGVYVRECAGQEEPGPCKCENFQKEHVFEVVASGKAAKWKSRYIVVLATNIKKEGGKYLCKPSVIKVKDVSGASEAGEKGNRSYKNTVGRVHRDSVEDKREHTPGKGRSNEGKKYLNEEEPCVIYVAKGDTFNYNAYKDAVKEILLGSGFSEAEIIPQAVEGYVMDGAMGNAFNSNWKTGLPILKKMPMSLTDFKKEFLPKNASYYGGARDGVFCEWPGFSIKAQEIEPMTNIKATLTFDPEVYGENADYLNVTIDRIVDEGAGREISGEIKGKPIVKDSCLDGVCRYHLDVKAAGIEDKLNDGANKASADEPFVFRVYWKATDKAGKSDKDDAKYTTGSEPGEDPDPNPNQNPQPNPACTEDQVMPLQGYANCQVRIVCDGGQYKDPVLSGDGCPQAGQAAGKLYFLAKSMDKVAVKLEEHRSYAFGQQDQPREVTGDVWYSNFQNKNNNNDLTQLNEGTVNASGENAAFAFIQQVVDKVNTSKSLPEGEKLLPLAKGATPRLAEFVDALHLGKAQGFKQVSKVAVCEFARGIVLASNDPTNDIHLHNTFGTFAIYIGLDSAYFPNPKLRMPDGKMVKDQRFSDAKSKYWWGGYVLNHTHAICPTSRTQIDATGFPLADLYEPAGGRLPVEGLRTSADKIRTQYVNTYGTSLFIQDGACSSLQGTMAVDDVLQYISKVIELGLGYKPEGCGTTGEVTRNGSSAATPGGDINSSGHKN